MLMNKTISDSDLLCEQSKIVLGHIYHMNHSENSVVALPTESLAYHTLITGSAGTGKSTVLAYLQTYSLLHMVIISEVMYGSMINLINVTGDLVTVAIENADKKKSRTTS